MDNKCHLCNGDVYNCEIIVSNDGNELPRVCRNCYKKISTDAILKMTHSETCQCLKEHCDKMDDDLSDYLSGCYDIKFYTGKLIVSKLYYDRLHTHRQIRKEYEDRNTAE